LNTQALQKRKTYGDHLALLVAGVFCLVASLLVVTLSNPGKPNVVPATT
jgi:hypothetical protein